MSRLILMRHGKAEPHGHGERDHSRSLSGRGRRDAKAVGSLLKARGVLPDVILCSDSARTVETTDAVLVGLADHAPDRYDLTELYLADPRSILDAIDVYAVQANTVMVVGHNPGLEELASWAASSHISLRTADMAILEDNEGETSLLELVPRPRME